MFMKNLTSFQMIVYKFYINTAVTIYLWSI